MTGIDSNTKALFHFWGLNGQQSAIDYSGNSAIITFNNTAQIKTDQYKYAPSSLWVDGDSDTAVITPNAFWNFAGNDFCIEWWVRPSVVNSDDGVIEFTADASNYITIGIYLGQWYITTFFEGTYLGTAAIGAVSADTWYHFVVERYGNNLDYYADGTSLATKDVTGLSLDLSSATLKIGIYSAANYMEGYIGEFQLSTIARYKGNFTPNPYPFHKTGNIITM